MWSFTFLNYVVYNSGEAETACRRSRGPRFCFVGETVISEFDDTVARWYELKAPVSSELRTACNDVLSDCDQLSPYLEMWYSSKDTENLTPARPIVLTQFAVNYKNSLFTPHIHTPETCIRTFV